MVGPDDNQALQFATMLHMGLPPSQAILYFTDSEDPREIAELTRKWQRSRLVKRESQKLLGDWNHMSDDEMAKAALGMHYRQLATMLVSLNYAEANAGEKGKMDSARTALEAKLAGTSGKGDALSQFFDDLRSKRISLPSQRPERLTQ